MGGDDGIPGVCSWACHTLKHMVSVGQATARGEEADEVISEASGRIQTSANDKGMHCLGSREVLVLDALLQDGVENVPGHGDPLLIQHLQRSECFL